MSELQRVVEEMRRRADISDDYEAPAFIAMANTIEDEIAKHEEFMEWSAELLDKREKQFREAIERKDAEMLAFAQEQRHEGFCAGCNNPDRPDVDGPSMEEALAAWRESQRVGVGEQVDQVAPDSTKATGEPVISEPATPPALYKLYNGFCSCHDQPLSSCPGYTPPACAECGHDNYHHDHARCWAFNIPDPPVAHDCDCPGYAPTKGSDHESTL